MTETSSLVASIGGADYQDRPTSVGVPVPVIDVRIVDDDGHDAMPGEIGEIWMDGAPVVAGYWNRPEATEETFGGGWLKSGDLARIDDEGFLYIVDRAKDMVIRGGENISSLEVEAALFDHPDVTEAAVFAVPHEALGEEVGAVVRLADGAGATPEELRGARGEPARAVQGAGARVADRRPVPARTHREDTEARVEGCVHATDALKCPKSFSEGSGSAQCQCHPRPRRWSASDRSSPTPPPTPTPIAGTRQRRGSAPSRRSSESSSTSFREFWAITKHADVMEIERHPEVFTNAPIPMLAPNSNVEPRRWHR